jgi:hypothetical protein
MLKTILRERQQYLIYLAISGVVEALTAIGYFFNPLLFESYLGRTHPVLVFLVVILVGVPVLAFLLSRGPWTIRSSLPLRDLLPLFGLVPLFALVAIAVDLRVGFAADMNVAFPLSLAFYPAIAFLVEIVFHVVPLALILLVLAALFKGMGRDTAIWIAIALVALVEPVFQTVAARSSKPFPLWATVLVAVNILLINLTQLAVFRRDGFLSMYALRLAYYSIWHILWGYLRLKILF